MKSIIVLLLLMMSGSEKTPQVPSDVTIAIPSSVSHQSSTIVAQLQQQSASGSTSEENVVVTVSSHQSPNAKHVLEYRPCEVCSKLHKFGSKQAPKCHWK